MKRKIVKSLSIITVIILQLQLACSLKEDKKKKIRAEIQQIKDKEPESDKVQNQNTVISDLKVNLIYDKHKENIEFEYDLNQKIFVNNIPTILPKQLPKVVTLKIPFKDGNNLQASAYIMFGSSRRDLHVDLDSKNKGILSDPDVIVELSPINGILTSSLGQNAEINIEISSDSENLKLLYNVKTPPALPTITETVLVKSLPIQVNPNIQANPLTEIQFVNNTTDDITLELPRCPDAELLHEIVNSTFIQGDCKITRTDSTLHKKVTDEFILVQSGSSAAQINSYLGSTCKLNFAIDIKSGASASFIFYALMPPGQSHPRDLIQIPVGSQKMLYQACHQSGTCSRKNVRHEYSLIDAFKDKKSKNLDIHPVLKQFFRGCHRAGYQLTGHDIKTWDGKCFYIQDVDCPRTGSCNYNGHNESEVVSSTCIKYFDDPDPSISYFDIDDIRGVGVQSNDLFEKAKVYYMGVTPLDESLTAPVSMKHYKTVLDGSYTF
jgi:hypothetical protein